MMLPTPVAHAVRLAVLLLALAVLLFPKPSHSAPVAIPQAAAKHRAELIRNARLVWGMEAPVATFAAQVHQESGWRPDAVSPVGAQGMAQFMPGTADWIANAYPALKTRQPFNPSWSLRALVTYDLYLWDRIKAANDCERMAMALAAYNGGLGWVWKDQKLAEQKGADRSRWFGHVEHHNSGRSAANFRENRGYPRRILLTLEPVYIRAGWGGGSCTPHNPESYARAGEVNQLMELK